MRLRSHVVAVYFCLSHKSFCEHHLPFTHHIGSCKKAYANKPRLRNKNRKREETNNSNGKGNRYTSQQEEDIKINGGKKRTSCKRMHIENK